MPRTELLEEKYRTWKLEYVKLEAHCVSFLSVPFFFFLKTCVIFYTINFMPYTSCGEPGAI